MPARRRFHAPPSRGSHTRTRPVHQLPGGEIQGARDDAERDDAESDEAKDVANDATSEEQLWVVDAGEGRLYLVRGTSDLKALIAEHGLTKTARVYMLSAISKTLGEVAEIRSAFASEPDASPPQSEPAAEAARTEPPVSAAEPVAEAGSAEPANQGRDDEFALLDRPFDDGEYFEDPRRAWVRPAGMAALLVALVAGGYGVFHSRSVPRSPAGGREHEAPTVAVAAPPTAEPAAVIPAAPAAPQPSGATPAVALADPGPSDPAGSAPAAQPPVAAPGAPSRKYPELVAEGERQFQEGHSKKAQASFEQALAETPEGTAALVGLAYVNLDRGKVPQAIALFQRALVQDRNDPTALFGLAESHRQEGNRSAALAEFQKFLTLRSTGSDADVARQLVRDLTGGE